MKYGTTDAVLKPLDEVILPDPRFEVAAIENKHGIRPFALSDIHERLCLTQLNPQVPPEVQAHFQTALNLMLYTWFVFEFQTVAEKQAYASLEFALRKKFPLETKVIKKKGQPKVIPKSLGELLPIAAKAGLVVAEDLPAWERFKELHEFRTKDTLYPLPPLPSASAWLEATLEKIPDYRNDLAHGSSKLYFESSFRAMELCADLINALFPKPATS